MAATPAKRQRPTRGDKPQKKTKNMSPEAREKLSRLAKQRHAEGRFGGAQFGKLGGRGNTKEKRRAASDLAEAIRDPDLVKLMVKTIKDSQDPERPLKQRMDGVKLAMEIERENEKLDLQRERADSEQLGRDQLIELLAKKLTEGPAAAVVRAQLAQEHIPDAVVVEEGEEAA